MLFIKKGLPLSIKQINHFVECWHNLEGGTNNNNSHEEAIQRSIFQHMYDNLTILDGKANSLLQFNAIMLAASGAFLMAGDNMQTSVSNHRAFLYTIACSLYSAILCHRVIWVYWSGSNDLSFCRVQITRLLNVRNSRTIYYRRAWVFSMLSTVFLGIFVIETAGQSLIQNYLGRDAILIYPHYEKVFWILVFILTYVYDDIILIVKRDIWS